MSMAAVLRQVRDHLRSAIPLAADQCGVQADGAPPESAGPLYVAIAERGVRSAAREYLGEEFEIEVCLWRQSGDLPADRRGDLLLIEDPYLAQLVSLDDLERAVLRRLHGNHADLPAAANARLDAQGRLGGGGFQLALYYAGRGATEVLRIDPKDRAAWFGRRLRFTGMTRVQPLAAAEG